MRQLFRRIVYLRLCGNDAWTRISVGTRIRIWAGTEMRGMCISGMASQRCHFGHTEHGECVDYCVIYQIIRDIYSSRTVQPYLRNLAVLPTGSELSRTA